MASARRTRPACAARRFAGMGLGIVDPRRLPCRGVCRQAGRGRRRRRAASPDLRSCQPDVVVVSVVRLAGFGDRRSHRRWLRLSPGAAPVDDRWVDYLAARSREHPSVGQRGGTTLNASWATTKLQARGRSRRARPAGFEPHASAVGHQRVADGRPRRHPQAGHRHPRRQLLQPLRQPDRARLRGGDRRAGGRRGRPRLRLRHGRGRFGRVRAVFERRPHRRRTPALRRHERLPARPVRPHGHRRDVGRRHRARAPSPRPSCRARRCS